MATFDPSCPTYLLLQDASHHESEDRTPKRGPFFHVRKRAHLDSDITSSPTMHTMITTKTDDALSISHIHGISQL